MKKKRILSLLLASTMLLSALPVAAAASDDAEVQEPESLVVADTADLPEYDSYYASASVEAPQLEKWMDGDYTAPSRLMNINVQYEMNSATGVLTISGTGAAEWDWEHITGSDFHWLAPTAVVVEEGITSLDDGLFSECSQLTSVSLPNTLTRISGYTFEYCTALTSIQIPDSVTTIGSGAFNHCTALTSIQIPDSVTTIGDSAFSGCTSLTDIQIPDSVTTIGGCAFSACTFLASIQIPDSVTEIGYRAFQGTGLTSLTLPKSIAKLSYNTFAHCENLTDIQIPEDCLNYKLVDGVIYDKSGETLVFVPFYKTGSYTVPDGVTTIADSAVTCTGITDITLPKTVTSIGAGAFWHNAQLTRVKFTNLNDTVNIQSCAFANCPNLTAVNLPAAITYQRFEWDIDGNPYISETIAGMAYGMFENCTSLPQLTIPGNIKSIGYADFNFCSNLSSIIIPSDVSAIDMYAFYSCDALTDVYYCGSQEQWAQIEISDNGNDPLKNATIHYNYVVEPESPFSDIQDPGAYYYDAVLWASKNDITQGVGDGKFAPDNACKRAQVVTFLWRAMGSPEPTRSDCPFDDVAAGSYYYKAVLWAVEKGITTGTSATRFSPNATVTRGQFVTFLWRAEGKPSYTASNPFTDLTAGSYYYDAVLWAVENGITTGASKVHFAPSKACVRGQVVTFLYRDLA